MANRKELEALIVLAGKVDPSLQRALKIAQSGSTKTAAKMANTAKGTQKTASTINSLAKGMGRFIGGIAKAGMVAGGAVVAGIAAMGKQGIELASNLNEVQNVVDTTFGGSAGQINKWSQAAKNSFGLSELQAKQFTGTMGAMLKSSGLTGKSMISMSENLSGLAGDFASFYNLDQEEAFEKIRSGISGETEPLKQLGINMSVANLEAYALSKGIKTSYQKMDQASQTALRYAYLMEVSKDAQGDFAKTLNTSEANQRRVLLTNAQQLLAKITKTSLPLILKLEQKANFMMDKIGDKIELFNKLIENGKNPLTAFKSVLSSAFGSDVGGKIGNIIDSVSTIGGNIIDLGKSVYTDFAPLVKDGFSFFTGTILPKLSDASTNILPTMKGIFGDIANISKDLQPALQAWGKYLTGNLLPALKDTLETLKGITGIVSGITGTVSGISQGDSGKTKTGLQKIGSGAGTALSSFNKVFDKVGFVANPLGWTARQIAKKLGMKEYAAGGFANTASIFAERGPEAAIPIKYKNPRSISLLNRTAQAIGANSSSGRPEMHFHFNFTGQVSKPQDVVDGVEMAKRKIYELIDEYFEDKELYSFGQ